MRFILFLFFFFLPCISFASFSVRPPQIAKQPLVNTEDPELNKDDNIYRDKSTLKPYYNIGIPQQYGGSEVVKLREAPTRNRVSFIFGAFGGGSLVSDYKMESNDFRRKITTSSGNVLSDATISGSTAANNKFSYDTGMNFGGMAGFGMTNGLNIFFEYTYHNAKVNKINNDGEKNLIIDTYSSTKTYTENDLAIDSKSKATINTLMINFMFEDTSPVRGFYPYLGAGFGYLIFKPKFKVKNATDTSGKAIDFTYNNISSNPSAKALAGQAFIGAAYRLSPTGEVFFGYKYVHSKDLEYGLDYTHKKSSGDLYYNSFNFKHKIVLQNIELGYRLRM